MHYLLALYTINEHWTNQQMSYFQQLRTHIYLTLCTTNFTLVYKVPYLVKMRYEVIRVRTTNVASTTTSLSWNSNVTKPTVSHVNRSRKRKRTGVCGACDSLFIYTAINKMHRYTISAHFNLFLKCSMHVRATLVCKIASAFISEALSHTDCDFNYV